MERRACDWVHDKKKKNFFQKAGLSGGFVLKGLFYYLLVKGKWSFRATASLAVVDFLTQVVIDMLTSSVLHSMEVLQIIKI